MRYYCPECSKDYSEQEFGRLQGIGTCSCGTYLVSCMKLRNKVWDKMRKCIIPPANCEECKWRFRCYTGGY